MNPAILLELASRWERDVKESESIPGPSSPDAQMEGICMGHREAKRECADALRSIVKLLS